MGENDINDMTLMISTQMLHEFKIDMLT